MHNDDKDLAPQQAHMWAIELVAESMTIDIRRKYCANSLELRAYLRQPFDLAGIGKVACNGSFGVVIPSDVTETSAGVPEKMPEVFCKWRETLAPLTNGIKAADIQIPEPVKCYECNGSGKVPGTEACEDCEGDGYFWRGDYRYECQSCDGEGRVKSNDGEPVGCPICDGTGEGFQTVAVGDTHFSVRFVKWIAELPDAEIFTNGLQTGFFKFTGGWGVVMPCRV